jgi:hypothetical protein
VLCAACGPPEPGPAAPEGGYDPCGEIVASEDPGEALLIEHHDVVGQGFVLLGILVELDGKRVHSSKVRQEGGPTSIRVTGVDYGDHELGIRLLYAGHGLGIFEYMNDYRFLIEAEHKVTKGPGAGFVKVVSREVGDDSGALENRIRIFLRIDEGGCVQAETRGKVISIEEAREILAGLS